MRKRLLPNGFTLVELLVTIVIIAILTSVGLTIYKSSQLAGRDGRRKQDIRNLSQSLELYFRTQGHFPCTGGSATPQLSTDPSPWLNDVCTPSAPMVSGFISDLPVDSINSGVNIYRYGSLRGANCRLSTDGGGFYLIAVLENSKDPEALGGGSHSLCDNSNVDSSWGGWASKAFVVSNQ